jgi:GNAT superfamily N-acetyltransferase
MLSIQPVSPQQIPILLEMIRELARFEKLEHEVLATLDSLQDSLFGPQPAAGAFLAFCDGHPAAYAIYFFTFSSFVGRRGLWLDDVYVRPEFRQRGIGRRLIDEVARVGVERQCSRFEWSALDWNENALNFYRRLGARTLDDWVLLRMDAAGLRRLAETPKPEL